MPASSVLEPSRHFTERRRSDDTRQKGSWPSTSHAVSLRAPSQRWARRQKEITVLEVVDRPVSIELFSVDTTRGALSFAAEQTVCTSPRFARFAQIVNRTAPVENVASDP